MRTRLLVTEMDSFWTNFTFTLLPAPQFQVEFVNSGVPCLQHLHTLQSKKKGSGVITRNGLRCFAVMTPDPFFLDALKTASMLRPNPISLLPQKGVLPLKVRFQGEWS